MSLAAVIEAWVTEHADWPYTEMQWDPDRGEEDGEPFLLVWPYREITLRWSRFVARADELVLVAPAPAVPHEVTAIGAWNRVTEHDLGTDVIVYRMAIPRGVPHRAQLERYADVWIGGCWRVFAPAGQPGSNFTGEARAAGTSAATSGSGARSRGARRTGSGR